MTDTTILAQQMVATRNMNLHTGPKRVAVGSVWGAQFILGQKDSRNCVPFLINGDNVI